MKRMFLAASLLAALISAALAMPDSASAQGDPRLNDFLSVAAKRSDLRLAIVSKGLDAAFADWLSKPGSGYAHHSSASTRKCCTQPCGCCK